MFVDLERVACPRVHSLNLWQSRELGRKRNWYCLPPEVSFHAMMWRVGKQGPRGLLDTQLTYWGHRETTGRKAPCQEILSKKAQWKLFFSSSDLPQRKRLRFAQATFQTQFFPLTSSIIPASSRRHIPLADWVMVFIFKSLNPLHFYSKSQTQDISRHTCLPPVPFGRSNVLKYI